MHDEQRISAYADQHGVSCAIASAALYPDHNDDALAADVGLRFRVFDVGSDRHPRFYVQDMSNGKLLGYTVSTHGDEPHAREHAAALNRQEFATPGFCA